MIVVKIQIFLSSCSITSLLTPCYQNNALALKTQFPLPKVRVPICPGKSDAALLKDTERVNLFQQEAINSLVEEEELIEPHR